MAHKKEEAYPWEQQLKKNARVRLLTRLLILFCIVLLLAVAALYFFVVIREVTVEGNGRLTESWVERQIFPDRGEKRVIRARLKEYFGTHREIPMIESYWIEFAGVQSAVIHVQEKEPVGKYKLLDQNYAYFDDEGYVLSVGEDDGAVPEIDSSLRITQSVHQQKLQTEDEEILDGAFAILACLADPDMHITAGTLSYQEGEYRYFFDKICVRLGRYDASTRLKLSDLNDMLNPPDGRENLLRGLSGTLDMREYDREKSQYPFKR